MSMPVCGQVTTGVARIRSIVSFSIQTSYSMSKPAVVVVHPVLWRRDPSFSYYVLTVNNVVSCAWPDHAQTAYGRSHCVIRNPRPHASSENTFGFQSTANRATRPVVPVYLSLPASSCNRSTTQKIMMSLPVQPASYQHSVEKSRHLLSK